MSKAEAMNPGKPSSAPRISVKDATSNTSKGAPSSPISSSHVAASNEQTFRMPPHSPISSSSNTSVSSPWDIVPSHSYAAASPYRCMATVTKRCGMILSLALSDAGLLYAGTESKAIRVWRHPGFFEISRLRAGSGTVEALLVSSKDGLVFSAHADYKVRVWNSTPVHTRKGTLPSAKDFLVEACRNRTRKALIKITSSSHSYTMFGGDSNNKLKHGGTITSLAYDAAAKLLYSASSDGTIKVWSTVEMKCVETVQAYGGSVNAVAVGPEAMVFSGSDDCNVKVWQRSVDKKRSHSLLFQVSSQGSPVTSIVVSVEGNTGGPSGVKAKDGYIVYAGCSDGSVRYWKKGNSTGRMGMAYLGCLRGHSHAVLCLATVEKVVISGSADASIRVWKRSGDGMAAHECTAILCSHIGPVKAVAAMVEAEGAYLVYSGSLDGSVKQWRVRREVCSTADDGVGSGGYFEISNPYMANID